MKNHRFDKKAFDSNFVSSSFEIGPGHKDVQKKQKIYNKGKSTDNPHEKDTFMKRTGPLLHNFPQAKKKTKRTYG